MIELGMAGVILALVLVPMIGVLQFSVKGTTESMHLTRAFQAARSAVDAIESFPFDRLDDAAAKTLVNSLPLPMGVAAPVLGPLEIVTETARNGEQVSAKIVTVVVAYDKVEGPNPRGEVRLSAMVVRAR